jgi:hypothetical protein
MVVSPTVVPEHRGTVAFLSHMIRDGDWLLPRVFRVAAAMGNVELDLTRVRIGPGTSRIEIRCMMASVTLHGPPDMRVECDVQPIVGSCDVTRQVTGAASPDAPLVSITGTAVLASVEVKVVDPNAPGWLDRLRGRVSAQGS